MTHPTQTPADAPPSLDPSVQPRPTPPNAGIWEDFIDVFHSPSAVFARREQGSILIPMIVVTAIIGIFFALNSEMLTPMLEAEFRREMAKAGNNPNLTAEQLQQMQSVGRTIAKVGAFLSAPIAMLLVGMALWIAGKFVGAKQTLHAAMVVAAYAYVPKALEAILVSVQALLLDTSGLDGRYRLQLGPARFLDPDTTSSLLLALLGRLDLFTLWVTVLLAIGLSVTGKISRGQAAIGAAIVWLAGGAMAVAFS